MNYRELYQQCLENGCTPILADMLAARSFPGTRGTDRAFMEGRKLDGSQFEGLPDIVGKNYVAKAQAAGVNPTGKYYLGGLARFPGDPEAWVDSTWDLKKRVEERGWSCQGAVNVDSPRYSGEDHSAEPYRVAADIVEDHVSAIVGQRPELLPKINEVREEVQGRLSGVHG